MLLSCHDNYIKCNVIIIEIALNDLLNEDITVDNQPMLAVDCKFVSLGPQTPEFLSLVSALLIYMVIATLDVRYYYPFDHPNR